jgi:hypothetical protein
MTDDMEILIDRTRQMGGAGDAAGMPSLEWKGLKSDRKENWVPQLLPRAKDSFCCVRAGTQFDQGNHMGLEVFGYSRIGPQFG